MATQEAISKKADEVISPHLSAQAAQSHRLKETELRQAKFMHIASIVLATAYSYFVVSRVINGRQIDALTIIVIAIMFLSVASTRRRYSAAKASLAAT